MASGGGGRDSSAMFFFVLVLGVAAFFWLGKDLLRSRQARDVFSSAMSGDKAAAGKLLKESEKSPQMAFVLARCHWQGGCEGIDTNPPKALQIWAQLAERVPEAAFNAGLIYEKGMVHGEPDTEKAGQYYRLAQAHSGAAAFRLAQMLEGSSPGEAQKLYLQAAMKDDNPLAAYKVGWLYYTQRRGADPVEAVKWFKRAAQTGLVPDAMYMLGYIHIQQTGLRTADDRIYAASWYLLAAQYDRSGMYRRKVTPFVLQLSENERTKAQNIAEQFISSYGTNAKAPHGYEDLIMEMAS